MLCSADGAPLVFFCCMESNSGAAPVRRPSYSKGLHGQKTRAPGSITATQNLEQRQIFAGKLREALARRTIRIPGQL